MSSTRQATRRKRARRKSSKKHGKFKGFRVDFWAALRKATHTDRLGHRLGMAVGTRIHARRMARKGGFSVPAGTRSTSTVRRGQPRKNAGEGAGLTGRRPSHSPASPHPTFTRTFEPYPEGSAYYKGAPTMSTETLHEAPETDVEHTTALQTLADRVRADADAVENYVDICTNLGIDPSALGPLESAAQSLVEAAAALEASVAAFNTTYEGIIETVESGVRLPGSEGGFFDRGRS
jgi:hypothetical protein